MTDYTGTHNCPCRDCNEIAVGGLCIVGDDGYEFDHTKPGFCEACLEAECDPTGQSSCQVERYAEPDEDEGNENGPGGLYQIGGDS